MDRRPRRRHRAPGAGRLRPRVRGDAPRRRGRAPRVLEPAMIASALVALPVVAAALCAAPLLSRWSRAIATLASLAVAIVAFATVVVPLATDARISWAAVLGASYIVDVDGVSAIFITLGGVVFAVGAAASAHVPHRRAYFALWCLLVAAVDGVF